MRWRAAACGPGRCLTTVIREAGVHRCRARGGLMVIDGDGHYVELPMEWVELVPRALRDQVYVTYGDDGRPERLVTGDVDISIGTQEGSVRGFGDAVTPGGLDAGRPTGRHI